MIVDDNIRFSGYRDAITISSLVLGFWACYEFVHGSILLQIVLAILFFVWLIAKSKKLSRKMSGPEALAYLKKKYEKGDEA